MPLTASNSPNPSHKEDVMKAVCWCGAKKVRVENVPDPKILDPQDIIVKISVTTP